MKLYSLVMSFPCCKNYLCRLSIEYINPYWLSKPCQEITLYCSIREIFWNKCLFFETLNAYLHINNNSTKKHNLQKRRHNLSIKSFLCRINHLGTCHYKPTGFRTYYVRNTYQFIYLKERNFRGNQFSRIFFRTFRGN